MLLPTPTINIFKCSFTLQTRNPQDPDPDPEVVTSSELLTKPKKYTKVTNASLKSLPWHFLSFMKARTEASIHEKFVSRTCLEWLHASKRCLGKDICPKWKKDHVIN